VALTPLTGMTSLMLMESGIEAFPYGHKESEVATNMPRDLGRWRCVST
jgi:hypothetical protein